MIDTRTPLCDGDLTWQVMYAQTPAYRNKWVMVEAERTIERCVALHGLRLRDQEMVDRWEQTWVSESE